MPVVLRWPANKWEKKAKLSCRLFGHVWKSGWWGDHPYLERKGGNVDGIGRVHFSLECECVRCYTKSTVARIHGEKNVLSDAS